MRQHLVGAGTSLTQKIKDVMGCDECIAEYEDIKKSSRVNSAGRASYVERNYWMIDESNYAIIYLKKNYSLSQSTSGTWLVYQYTIKKDLILFLLP